MTQNTFIKNTIEQYEKNVLITKLVDKKLDLIETLAL